MALPPDDVDRERVGDPSLPDPPRGSRRRLDMTAATAAAAAVAVAAATDLASGSSRRGSRHGSRPESVDGGDDVPNPTDTPDEIQSEFRERLWGYLLGNMVRAVDEVYFLCELECGASEIEGAATLLEESARDFRELATRLKSQEEYAASPGASRSISWDVGRTDVRPSADTKELIRAVSLAEARPTANPNRGEDARAGSNLDRDERDDRGGEWRTAGRGGKSTKPGGGAGGTGTGTGAGGKKHRGGKNGGGKGGGKGDGKGRDVVVGSSDRVASTRSPSFRRSFTDPSTELAAAAEAADAVAADTSPDRDRSVRVGNANGNGNPNSNPLAGRPPRATSASASTSTSAIRNAVVSDAAKRASDAAKRASEAASKASAAADATSSKSKLKSKSSGAKGSSWADDDEDDGALPSPMRDEKDAPDVDSADERVDRAEPSEPSERAASASGGSAWGVKRNWGAILAPLDHQKAVASRLMHRGKHDAPHAMHAKLMSPERKRKTAQETAAAMRERHERAREARAALEEERAARLRARERAVERADEEAERRAAERARELEARHRRAEETREERISAVVRKAGEETRKVEEIAFYNSLEAENKKAALRERLDLAERRRTAAVEERRRAAESAEQAARAAEERRAAEEERKRAKFEEKVREREARRAREAAEREADQAALAERRAMAAAEKESARAAREMHAKAETEARRDEMRRRLLAADARRREYLDVVRERATGSSTPGGKEANQNPNASSGGREPGTSASGSSVLTASLAHPASPSRASVASPGRGASGAANQTPDSPSRDRERRVAAVADRHRAMRKRAKKLRHRLHAAAGTLTWRTHEASTSSSADETRDEEAEDVGYAPLPPFAESARPRLERAAREVARRRFDAAAGDKHSAAVVSSAATASSAQMHAHAHANAHRETQTALAEAGAAAAAAGAEEKSESAPGAAAASAALAAAVTSGLVRRLAEALAESFASSAHGGGFAASPAAAAACASLAAALDVATAGSPHAAEALLRENLVAPLVPHLVAGLGLVGDPAAAETATPAAGGGIPPPVAALEPLLAVVARVVRGPEAVVGVGIGAGVPGVPGVGVGAGFGAGTAAAAAGVEDASEPAATEEDRHKRIPSQTQTQTQTQTQAQTNSRRLPSAKTRAMRADFVELLVASGAVDALASLFALFDRPKEQVAPVPGAIVAGLRLLEALLDARAPDPGRELADPADRVTTASSSGVERAAVLAAAAGAASTSSSTSTSNQHQNQNPSDGESPAGSLIAALEATALAGLPTLLTSVLLHTEAELRAPVLQDPGIAARALPADFVPVAATVLRLLNATARFGPETAQRALSSPDLRVETHHLLSFMLALCASEWDSAREASERAERDRRAGRAPAPGEKGARAGGSANAGATAAELADLLDQTVLFIGAFALMCPANQDMLCWGRAPTLMQRLPDLPFEYYSSPEKIATLFPTLVAVAFRHGTNRELIARELSLETVREFVARERAARERGEGTSAASAAGLPPQFEFAARFPPAKWAAAEAYFDPKGSNPTR